MKLKYYLYGPVAKDPSYTIASKFYIDEATGTIYTNGTLNDNYFENSFLNELTLVAMDSVGKNSVKATIWIDFRTAEKKAVQFRESSYQ